MATADKKAFVFDTNFIIQTRDLEEVIKNLSDHYSVYVTQVSVEERIAQECREINTRYQDHYSLIDKYSDIARIEIIQPCDKTQEFYRTGMQKKYEIAFGNRLIPFAKDGEMLSKVLDRAYRKKPPFLADEKASDKGFKDALIWESMLAYFRENGEQEVFFITDDKGFTNNKEVLCAEFVEKTGKTLSFHPNSFYRELLRPETVKEPMPHQQIPNIEQLREQIQSVINDLCYVETVGYWGDEQIEQTFTTNKVIDANYVQTVFYSLKKEIYDHVFEPGLPASAVLELDNRITDTEYMIPMPALENAANLYDIFMENYPEYIEQFFSAAAKLLNRNYRNNPKTDSANSSDEEELPF